VTLKFPTAKGLITLSSQLLLGALLAGCGLSGMTSGIGGGMIGGSTASTDVKSVNEEQLLLAAKADGGASASLGGELSQGCPRFLIWPRDNAVTIYEPGRVGDGLAVMHRGEITKTARECQVENGRVTVRYGFSGRVLLGPRGRSGTVSLPISVFVADSKRERIVSDKMKVEVGVAVEKPIGYFSMVRTISFNVPEGSRPAEFDVFIGLERNLPNAG
jgi:hypothetical protein